MKDDNNDKRNLVSNFADWRFDRYLTMQLLPWFYLILVLACGLLTIFTVTSFFHVSMLAGITSLVVAPFGFLVAVAVVRAALEYLVMAHRIMNIIERMDEVPKQVEGVSTRVDDITEHVDRLIESMDHVTETIVMLKPLLESASIPSRMLRSLRGRNDDNTPPDK